jgi:hypothetical protein
MIQRLNPRHWAEVRPGIVLVPCWRGGSTSLLTAVRLMQGIPFHPASPHIGFHAPQHPDFGIRLRSVPEDVEFVIVGRDPISRFESARAFMRGRPYVPTADWKHFIAWATHATDGHVVSMTRLVDRYFTDRPHRLVRIEDYAAWGPEIGLPSTLPRLHVSEKKERLPAKLRSRVIRLYASDYQRFNYPIPQS